MAKGFDEFKHVDKLETLLTDVDFVNHVRSIDAEKGTNIEADLKNLVTKFYEFVEKLEN